MIGATEEILGKPFRKQIVSTITLEERLSLTKRKSDKLIPILVENKPIYIKEEDDDGSPDIAEWYDDKKEIILRIKKGMSAIPFADYFHELGHAVYRSMSSDHVTAFKTLYDCTMNEYIKTIKSGRDPVTTAQRICSYQFFLSTFDPADPGFICWHSFVGQDYKVESGSDMLRYFHRKRIPEVEVAHKITFDPEEAFAELFANYFKLRRRPKPYKIMPNEGFVRNENPQREKIYRFAKRHMKRMIASARPSSRKQRSLI